jgi:hypothetical protein
LQVASLHTAIIIQAAGRFSDIYLDDAVAYKGVFIGGVQTSTIRARSEFIGRRRMPALVPFGPVDADDGNVRCFIIRSRSINGL